MIGYNDFKLILIRITVFMMAAYFFWIAVTGMPEPLIVCPIFVGFVLFLGFLGVGANEKDKKKGFGLEPINWCMAILGAAQAIYIQIEYERIVNRLIYFDDITLVDWFFGITTILLVLELTRRMVGKILVILIMTFLFYTIFGNLFPGFLRHPGIPMQILLEQFFLSTNGLFGSLTSLALAEVLMFIFLGAFLQAAGGTEFFTRLAEAATKRARGGPAKAAVIGSALFGAISGSGVANVYAKNIDGLLVAGRCYSVTHAGLGLAKSVPVMMALGQAAGTAAALSINMDVRPRSLDVNALQQKLVSDGVFLPNVEADDC
jgi:TRAP-type uncharacterized transport system fused permease subunit